MRERTHNRRVVGSTLSAILGLTQLHNWCRCDNAIRNSGTIGSAIPLGSHAQRIMHYSSDNSLLDVARPKSGRRTYDAKTVERLDFLVRMRTSGMGISALRRYVDLVRAGDATTEQRLEIMCEQRERIKSQIHELELALVTTDYKIAKYGGAPDDDRSPACTSPNLERPQGEPS